MNKNFILGLAAGILAFLLSASFSSAYNYGGYFGPNNYNNQYDQTTYHVTRVSGNGPYVTTRDTFYNRQTESFWNGREWVDRTTYVKEVRENPGYNYVGYNSAYYGNYYLSGYNYNSRYYGNDYNPWYQKYWSNSPVYSGNYCTNCYVGYNYRY